MKCIYPAIFTWIESDKIYMVDFPDIEGCFTYGYSLPEAFEYAADILNLMLWDIDEKNLPPATKLEDIKPHDSNSFVQYIFADPKEYKKYVKYVRLMETNKIKRAEKFSKSA